MVSTILAILKYLKLNLAYHSSNISISEAFSFSVLYIFRSFYSKDILERETEASYPANKLYAPPS